MLSPSASPTNASEIMSLASSGQENFVPAAEEAAQEAPHTFLSLAPIRSASYPVSPLARSPAVSPAANGAQESLDELLLKTRRSSSLASDASGNGSVRRRFLKLGPVHFGEGDGDWSEDVVDG